MTLCPTCQTDVTPLLRSMRRDQAIAARQAWEANSTPEQRTAIARRAGKAQGKRSKKAKALSAVKRAESLRAYWASEAGLAQKAKLSRERSGRLASL